MIDLLSYFQNIFFFILSYEWGKDREASYCFISYLDASFVPNRLLYRSIRVQFSPYKWYNGIFLFKSILIVLKFNKNIFFKYFSVQRKVLLLQDILQWIHFIWNGGREYNSYWTNEKRMKKICKFMNGRWMRSIRR